MFYAELHNRTRLYLLSGSDNCTSGNAWVWRHLGQCLEGRQQGVGFIFGILAILLWSSSHTVTYRFLWKHACDGRHSNVAIFVFLHWCSDVLSCVGAWLAQQLASQVLFGLSVVVVNSLCCLHYVAKRPRTTNDKKEIRKYGSKINGRIWSPRLCLYPVTLILPALSLAGVYYYVTSPSKQDAADVFLSLDSIPVVWVLGYATGVLGGILHCCAKLVDILDSYITVDFTWPLTVAYFFGAFGEISYASSVYTQNREFWFFQHTLPWILPRLISAGLDIGILLQRTLQWRRGRIRKLFPEDADGLLSSDEDAASWSSGSEEVLWVSLRPNVPPTPHHPLCVPRILIVSESDAVSENADLLEPADDGVKTQQLLDLTDENSAGRTPESLAGQSEPDSNVTEDITEARDTYGNYIPDDVTYDPDTETDEDDTDCSEYLGKGRSEITTINTVSSEEKIASWIQLHDDSFETTFLDDT